MHLKRFPVHFFYQDKAFFQILHGILGILVFLFSFFFQGICHFLAQKRNTVKISQQVQNPRCLICLFLTHAPGGKHVSQVFCNGLVQAAHMESLLRYLVQQLLIVGPDCLRQACKQDIGQFPAVNGFFFYKGKGCGWLCRQLAVQIDWDRHRLRQPGCIPDKPGYNFYHIWKQRRPDKRHNQVKQRMRICNLPGYDFHLRPRRHPLDKRCIRPDNPDKQKTARNIENTVCQRRALCVLCLSDTRKQRRNRRADIVS